MNLGKLSACGAKVRLMDLGGSIKMRPLWERYYKDVHAITFVFDVSPSCEVSKLMEARAYYRCMRDDESLRNVPIMIFANKTDTRKRQQEPVLDDEELDDKNLLIGDTSLLDIAELFLSPPRGMSTDSGERSGPKDSDDYGDNGNISMFAGSAKTGEGVVAAFDWLIRKGAERVHQLRKSEEI
jgi:GTPase SAR1 family protein